LCRPQSGTVELFGKPVSWGNHYPQLAYIGDPSHNPYGTGVPTGISVEEIVESFRQLWDSPLKAKLINTLELDALYKNDAGELSTGQRKRLMAFLALAKDAKLVIADEATEGLDENAKPKVIDLVKEISKDQGCSLLWISHRRDEIAFLTNEVYKLSPDKEHIGELIKHDIKGFKCQVKTDSDECLNGESYQDKDGLLSIIANICLNPSISYFQITGTRNQEES
jgi:ABC-type multidrug transport system ATPase subunit